MTNDTSHNPITPAPPSAPPAAPGATAPGAGTVPHDTACSGCSYNIRGLPVIGKCPECGVPVADSIRGNLLRFANPTYRNEVQAGLGLVLNGILLSIIIVVVAIVLAASEFGGVLIDGLLGLALLGTSVMIAFGYWRYTTPDPGLALDEQAGSARAVARIAVVVGAVCTLAKTVIEFGAGVSSSHPSPASAAVLGLLIGGFGLAQLIAWAVQFFAIMSYTAFLADRIPDHEMVAKARRYRWMLPLIAIVGVIALMLGPLISLVLYWNLLHRLRKAVQAMG